MKRSLPNQVVLVGLVLFVFALVFRLAGIGWGLKNELHNASYHPDEPVIFGYSRFVVPGQGQFTPHFYSYGTLYLTALRIASDVTTTYTGGPKVKGDGFSFTHPELTDWDWVSRCDMAGRILTALAGAGTAVVIFALLARFLGVVAGVAAGTVIAIAPAHLIHSRFQTVDVTAVFLLALSLYYCSLIAGERDQASGEPTPWKQVILAGVFAGLSAGTKYTGIVAILSLLVAIGVRKPKNAVMAAIAGCAASFVAMVLATPGALLEPQAFWHDFWFEIRHTSTGHGLVFVGTPTGFVYHILNLFVGIGPLIVLIGVAGLGWAAYRRQRWAWVLLAFTVPYFLLIARAEVKFIRYTLPIYPAVAVGFGYAMIGLHRRGGWYRLGVAAGIFGAGGFPYGGLSTSIAMTRGMMGEDPRDTAARYIKTQPGPVGFTHNSWFWSPPLFPNSAEPLSVQEPVRLDQMAHDSQPPIAFVTNPDGSPTEFSQRLISQVGPPQITFSSFQVYPMFRLKDRKDLGVEFQPEVDNGSAFLDQLQKRYVLDRLFGDSDIDLLLPEDFLYTRPVVWVWKKR